MAGKKNKLSSKEEPVLKETKKPIEVVAKPEPKPEPKPKPKSGPKVDPIKVIPSKKIQGLETAECLVTKTKFIVNKWWSLKRGREITAPKVVIDALRNAGFVK